jgi:hypothetical protein
MLVAGTKKSVLSIKVTNSEPMKKKLSDFSQL